jgi:hypothetical protein
MQAYASTTAHARISSRVTPWQFPALIVATLLVGLVASTTVASYNGNPALVDGTNLLLGP